MPNTDRDSMLERWANGAETLAQYYEDLYGPPPDPPQLPALTTYDGLLEAIVEATLRAKRNINKISPTYHSDSVAYVKTVPSGDVHYASLDSIGGKTVVWNQLAPDGYSKTGAGTTALNSGTQIVKGHKYLISRTLATADNSVLYFYTRQNGVGSYMYIAGTNTATIETAPESGTSNGTTSTVDGNAWIYQGNTANTVTNLMLIDITLMYGSGNEPTTVEEFQQMFPADYYAFNNGTLLSAGVTSVISKDADNTTLQTVSIPAEVQALEGYGWSAGTVFNYIDYERKVFVKRVASVDLGTLTFGYGPTVGWSATLPNVKNPADDDTAFNGLSATLKVTDRNTQASAFDGGTDAGMVSVTGGKVYVGTGSISIVPSGTLIYELDEPVETDISAYLADDGLIEVEAGGSLTFPNSNGDDYRIPVPSSETFVVGEP